MPEIKPKHVVSFSSEDKVHKAENLLKPETYRKWKCASAGESKASVILQLEKATQIQSIDIGNENSAFVEVLVGRSSDSANDYQVLLVASSFMSPLESRNGTNTNRVRMFGPEKLAQNVKNEKWDCVQIVCTQPFNKNVQYGLSFIKFYSPPDPSENLPEKPTSHQSVLSFGAFKLKNDDENEEIPVGSFFSKRKEKTEELSTTGPAAIRQASSFAASVLAANDDNSSIASKSPVQTTGIKRKLDDKSNSTPPKKTSPVVYSNKEKNSSDKKEADRRSDSKNNPPASVSNATKASISRLLGKSLPVKASHADKKKMLRKKPLHKVMEKVVFALSGFVNPLRSEIRDKALEMGAKYKADWDRTCTHLICAFVNTPKYIQVRSSGGRIVKKEWIFDCHKQKTLLPWRNYMLGTYSKDSTSEEEEEEEEEMVAAVNTKHEPKNNSSSVIAVPKLNGVVKKDSVKDVQSLNSSDLNAAASDDIDADIDYKAATDVDSDSGGDTEDEIEKVKKRLSANTTSPLTKNTRPQSKNLDLDDDESREEEMDCNFSGSSLNTKKIDTKNLSLPPLPDIFKNRYFFLYGSFLPAERHILERYIIGYNGNIEEYMSDKVKYIITQAKWDHHFDEALAENENLVFVSPKWIYQCKEKGKLVPYQPYIIVPET